ncbi:MAG: tetratricopeptide repeat protein [Ignavibacterium sp.]|nr:MAG: tetratricopeptide repeat protein [Ignavibacterium sp.]
MVAKDKISIASEYFNKAYDLHLRGKIDDAINNYKLSIESYPTAKAHTYLGWAYSLHANYEEAIEECKTAIELDPDFGNPYNDIGSYLISLGKLDEAIIWLEKAIDAEDYEPRHFPYFNLGRIYERKGDWFTAMKYYEDALDVNPDYEIAKSAVLRLTAMLN